MKGVESKASSDLTTWPQFPSAHVTATVTSQGVTDPKLTSLPPLMKKYIGKDKDTSW